jgi:ABC-type Zn uptake system ZnuABC Zn-binding protein ZnuA
MAECRLQIAAGLQSTFCNSPLPTFGHLLTIELVLQSISPEGRPMAHRNRLLTIAGAAALVVAMFTHVGCTKTENPWNKVPGGKLKVLVTFPPLYCFTRGVAGDDAKVETLLTTAGPHEHSPDASDAHLAFGANLFLASGLTLDDFVTDVAAHSGNRSIKIVKVADKALARDKLLRLQHQHGDDHDEHGHKHGQWDPHTWLGIEQAILMVNVIRDVLKEADPAHAAGYDTRAAAYVKKLEDLQAEGKKLLDGKKNRKLIAMHESLGYFCKSFDLDLVDSVMPRPGVEADLPKLAELLKICQKDNIRILAIEPQYDANKARTLGDSLKQRGHVLELVEIDPMETCEHREDLDADYYFKVMRRNLQNLAKHMQ